MEINKINYEKYVLDFIEGTMNATEQSDFNAFINANPAIYDEIKEYLSAPIMAEEPMVYSPKRGLRKRIVWPYWIVTAVLLISLGTFSLLNPEAFSEKEIQEQLPTFAELRNDESQSEEQNMESDIADIHEDSEEVVTIDEKKENVPVKTFEMTPKVIEVNKVKDAGVMRREFLAENNVIAKLNNSIDEHEEVPESTEAVADINVSSEKVIREVSKIDALPNQATKLYTTEDEAFAGIMMDIPDVERTELTEKREKGWKNFIKNRVIPRTYQDTDISQAISDVNPMEDRSFSLRKLKDAVIPETFAE